ncbi:MAG: flagellar filament capping protein FliD [Oscillospiraceae bacterium]|jgi:flagellar hook-associated protein 2|nr:flagellar filament capping protein FliD [Oscillospiraceae bacterium]
MAVTSITSQRLTGLASGLDTDSIIKSLMQIEQMKVDREVRNKTKLLWKQEAITGIKNELTTFKQTYMSIMSPQNLVSESVYNAFAVKMSGDDSGAVTLTSTVHSTPSAITISKVSQLATGATAESTDKISSSLNGLYGADGGASTTKLKDLQLSKDLFSEGDGTISFKINGESFSFSKDDTLGKMMSTINASDANVTMTYSGLTDTVSFASKTMGAASTLKIENIRGNAFGADSAFGINTAGPITGKPVADKDGVFLTETNFGMKLEDFPTAGVDSLYDANGKISFKINDKTFTYTKGSGTTLQDVINDVHAQLPGVNLSFDDATHQFTISSVDGDGKTLGITPTIENISGNIFGANSVLGIDSTGSQTGIYQNGQNARLTINGVEVEREANSFVIDGIGYTLNRTTDKPIEAAIVRDASPAIEKIKGFIDGYNTIISKLENLLSERKTTDEASYVPLTDEERAAMTEDEIAAWEAIAKKGILRNDSGIQSVLSSLRSALYESVTGAGLAPSSIGIATGQYSAGGKGQIVLDEAKLRAALESDPERVMSVFTNTSASADTATAYKENGLITRMNNILTNYMSGKQLDALDNLESSVSAITQRIADLEAKMVTQQERLYTKYAAMETALSNLNSQSDWLAGVLGTSS